MSHHPKAEWTDQRFWREELFAKWYAWKHRNQEYWRLLFEVVQAWHLFDAQTSAQVWTGYGNGTGTMNTVADVQIVYVTSEAP